MKVDTSTPDFETPVKLFSGRMLLSKFIQSEQQGFKDRQPQRSFFFAHLPGRRA